MKLPAIVLCACLGACTTSATTSSSGSAPASAGPTPFAVEKGTLAAALRRAEFVPMEADSYFEDAAAFADGSALAIVTSDKGARQQLVVVRVADGRELARADLPSCLSPTAIADDADRLAIAVCSGTALGSGPSTMTSLEARAGARPETRSVDESWLVAAPSGALVFGGYDAAHEGRYRTVVLGGPDLHERATLPGAAVAATEDRLLTFGADAKAHVYAFDHLTSASVPLRDVALPLKDRVDPTFTLLNVGCFFAHSDGFALFSFQKPVGVAFFAADGTTKETTAPPNSSIAAIDVCAPNLRVGYPYGFNRSEGVVRLGLDGKMMPYPATLASAQFVRLDGALFAADGGAIAALHEDGTIADRLPLEGLNFVRAVPSLGALLVRANSGLYLLPVGSRGTPIVPERTIHLETAAPADPSMRTL